MTWVDDQCTCCRQDAAEHVWDGRNHVCTTDTTQTTEIRVPMRALLTANQRLHWAEKARRTKHLRTIGLLHGRRLTPAERAHIEVAVGWPDKRRRDVMNVQPTIKATIDGLVDADALPDDSDEHLLGPDLRAYRAGVRGHVVLTFHFTPITPRRER